MNSHLTDEITKSQQGEKLPSISVCLNMPELEPSQLSDASEIPLCLPVAWSCASLTSICIDLKVNELGVDPL